MAKGTVNKATVLGNCGDAPDLKFTPNGTQVARVNVATTHRYKKNDEWVETTEWHRLIFWAGLAEIAAKYLKKGSKVYVEGRMQKRTYQDANNVTREIHEIIVSDMQMLGDPRSAETKEAEAFQTAYAGGHPVLPNYDAEDPADIPF